MPDLADLVAGTIGALHRRVKHWMSRQERIEEVVAIIIPFVILALFALLGPRFVSLASTDPIVLHIAR